MTNGFLRTLLLGSLWLLSNALQAAPHDLILIIDNSGSMRKIDPELVARRAATEFLASLPDDFRAGVILFDQSARLVLPLTPAGADNGKVLSHSLDSMNYRGQFTDSPAAVERALFELKSKGRPEAAKSILFVSDGIVDTGTVQRDTERGRWLREELAVEAAAAGVRIMPIAFTENADLLLIGRLAEATGGRSARAIAPSDLPAAYREMLDSLTSPAAASPPPAATAEAPAAPTSAPAAPEVPADAAPPVAPAEPPAATIPETASPAAAAPAAAAATAAVPPVAAPPSGSVPPVAAEPPVAEPPAAEPPAAGDTVTVGGMALTPEEYASLEQFSRDAGAPIEQLIEELRGAPVGAAVVVPPGGEAPSRVNAPAGAAPGDRGGVDNAVLLAGGLGALLLAGICGFMLLRRRSPATAAAIAGATTGAAPAAAAAARPTGPAVPEAFLFDLGQVTEASTRSIGERQVVIGRAAGTDTEYLDYFVINKATVGRRHAIIKFKDRAFWIVDQGSVNGTYVNNERVTGERMLKHGDRLKFHKFEFEFSFPDMTDPNRAVLGISGDQTIVAGQDSTLAATAASLSSDTRSFAATGAARTAAWLNKDALDAIPGAAPPDDDPFDIAREGDLDALESDRDAFFGGGSPEPAIAPPAEIINDGDDTFDDEDFGTVGRAGMRGNATGTGGFNLEDDETVVPGPHKTVLEAATMVLAPAPARAPEMPAPDFGEAAAFFDDATVGPAPDLMRGPSPELEADLDVLDVTRVPGIGDNDPTNNFAPPATVMPPAQLAVIADTRPPLDTGSFGELTTVSHALGASAAPVTMDDFAATGTFETPRTLLPEHPSHASGKMSVDEFIATGLFDAPVPAPALATPTGTINEDIFDVTGTDDMPSQETVILDGAPRLRREGDPPA